MWQVCTWRTIGDHQRFLRSRLFWCNQHKNTAVKQPYKNRQGPDEWDKEKSNLMLHYCHEDQLVVVQLHSILWNRVPWICHYMLMVHCLTVDGTDKPATASSICHEDLTTLRGLWFPTKDFKKGLNSLDNNGQCMRLNKFVSFLSACLK